MSAAENKAVFLSYASQDAEAARRICDSLRSGGVEVWFDADGGLEHGDEWDAKIRRQIKECVLFIPVISANTQAREEGYFRLEWDLAAERARTIASGVPFILPVVIDDTKEPAALVPDRFRAVQWTRLRGGEVPPDVLQRFLKLWSHRTGLLKSQAVSGAGAEPAAPLAVAAPEKKSSLPLVPIAVAAAVLVGGGAWWFLRQPSPQPAAPAPLAVAAPVKPAPAPAPRSEARQLADRAYALSVDKYDSTLDDYNLAESLMQRALALDGSDGEILARSAALQLMFRNRGFDYGPERIAKGREQAERAVRLVPDSAEAVYALSLAQSYTGNRAAAVESLERVIAIDPNHARALLSLGAGRISQGKPSEGLAFYARARLQPEWAPLADYYEFLRQFGRREFADADRLVRSSYGAGPSANNAAGIALVHLTWDGDLDTATRELAAIPVKLRNAPRIICVTAFVQLNRRQPEDALKALDRLTDEFVQDAWSTGPKASLVGRAHAMAGRDTAARLAWESGLTVIEARLKNSPGDASYHHSRGMLLAWLGRAEEALQEARTVQELNRGAAPVWRLSEATIYAALGRAVLALPLIEKMLNDHGSTGNWPISTTLLRQDPLWDKIRDEPGFQKLLREPKPETKPSLSAAAPAADEKSAPADKSVAVLAFDNRSDEKDAEYFSDGISDELLNQLGKVPGLRVAGRNSAFAFKGKIVPDAEIAQKLGVAYLVNGTVQKVGSQVRINARLTHAASGTQVWSEKFTEELKDIFAVQDRIAGLIAQHLQLTLGYAPRVAATVNPEAHRLVLEGRYFWNQRSEEGFRRAEAAFAKAIEIDPRFAPAHSGLAGVCVIRDEYRRLDGFSSNPEDATRARTEAQRAIELDPTLAEPHAVLGYSWRISPGHLREADEEFQLALKLNPNDAVARNWHAQSLAMVGRLDACLPEFEKVAELDPLAFINLQVYAGHLAYARRYDEALKMFRRADALRPDVFIPNRSQQAQVLLALGRRDEAVAAARFVRQHQEITPRWAGDAYAIEVLREAGLETEAAEFAKTVRARPGLPADSYLHGMVLTALGRLDEALPYLQRMPTATFRHLIYDLRWDAWRDDPRFQRVIAQLGIVEEYQRGSETLARMLKEQSAKK